MDDIFFTKETVERIIERETKVKFLFHKEEIKFHIKLVGQSQAVCGTIVELWDECMVYNPTGVLKEIYVLYSNIMVITTCVCEELEKLAKDSSFPQMPPHMLEKARGQKDN